MPVASAAPSVVSRFDGVVTTRRALAIAISQSGRSPDLLATVAAYAKGGAHVAALVNDQASPLAEQADTALPLCAGPERSVAATKSCIAAMAGLAGLVAAWSQDEAFAAAVAALQRSDSVPEFRRYRRGRVPAPCGSTCDRATPGPILRPLRR